MRARWVIVAATATAALAPLGVRPAAAVDIGTLRVGLSRIASGFSSPTAIAAPRDGSGRLFVVQKGGAIRVRRSSGAIGTYLNVPGVLSGGERGLLGLVFHPSFASNGYLFVAYTDQNGALQVSRFRASPPSAGSVAASTQTKIINVPHPDHANHNAGQLAFGPDGYLYVGTGDGGGGGDPDNNAHDTSKLLGKILRIDVNRTCGSTQYCIPSSNPFASSSTSRKEIWHYGLRNPWRFSFDRSAGVMWIADVGQGAIEEVNRVGASQSRRNFGWDCWEGTRRYTSASYCTPITSTTPPVTQYDHSAGDCAVIGGFAYRGSRYAANMAGIYLFGDYCTGYIRGVQATSTGWRTRLLHDHGGSLTSFGEDPSGELYAVDEGGGLYRVTASGGVTAQPKPPASAKPSAKPSPSPSAKPSPSPTPTSASPVASPSIIAGAPQDGGGVNAALWIALAVVLGGGAVATGAWFARRRRA